jgi:hypothetical protein
MKVGALNPLKPNTSVFENQAQRVRSKNDKTHQSHRLGVPFDGHFSWALAKSPPPVDLHSTPDSAHLRKS